MTVEYHYETLGRILTFLAQKGFARVRLDELDAMNIMSRTVGDEADVLTTFANVLHWMHAEGLIRVSQVHEHSSGYIFAGVQLTSKGIGVLQANPGNEAIGESIEKRAATNSDGEIRSPVFVQMGEFVGSLLGGFTKSISS